MGPPYSSRADVPTLLNYMIRPIHVRDCYPLWDTFHPITGLKYCYLFQGTTWLRSIIRLIWVHSPLLPESRLISFPVGTVMVYFPTYYLDWFTLGLNYLYYSVVFKRSASFLTHLLGIPKNPFGRLVVYLADALERKQIAYPLPYSIGSSILG